MAALNASEVHCGRVLGAALGCTGRGWHSRPARLMPGLILLFACSSNMILAACHDHDQDLVHHDIVAMSNVTGSVSSGAVKKRFTTVTLVVDDYDKAIDWYTKVLEFEVVHNEARPGGGRFVTMAPNGAGSHGVGVMLSLATDSKPERQARLGNQVGDGGVFMILHTDNFDKDYKRMKGLEGVNVEFCEEPRDEPYGKVVIFKDLYGNKFDLIEENES